MAEDSSNQDYGANYTVDDDDFDISSDDDDTFDENDITPRNVTQVNSSAFGSKTYRLRYATSKGRSSLNRYDNKQSSGRHVS